jgi:uncharacterized protein
MDIRMHWSTIRKIVNATGFSSFHCSIATVNPDGSPHVTPIGSLVLDPVEPKGFYVEEYLRQMSANIERHHRVSILAVNSSKLFWLKSLFKGEFAMPPAVRLNGAAGRRREATAAEMALWQKKIRPFRRLKGYELLWKNMKHIREIQFDTVEPVNTGIMTRNVWQ